MEKFKIALAQMASEAGDLPANLEKMLGYIRRAAKEGAQMVVFPEMCLTGYMVMDGKDFHNFFALASDFKDAASAELIQEARHHNLNIIYGTSSKSPRQSGIFYNSAVLVTAAGELRLYHKSHAPTGNKGGAIFYEGLYYKPGNEFPVYDVQKARLGMQVCYDMFFPEVSRILAIKGAEVLVNISAAPVTSRAAFETVFGARALENTCYLVYVNTVGPQKGMNFFGGSRVLNPLGGQMLLLSGDREDFGTVELDPELMAGLRRNLPHLRDRARRPEIYKELCQDFE